MGASWRFWCQKNEKKENATNPAFLILPMDIGSEYSEKMLKIHLLPGVFGPEKVKKIKK